MRKLLLVVLPLSLFLAFALAGCAYEYDAAGKLYPPDSACSEVEACFQAGNDTLQTCLGGVVAGESYVADVWACVDASDCLNDATTSAQFQAFLTGCFGDSTLDTPFDALFLSNASDTLASCFDGDKADQGQLIDVCATE